MVTTHNLGFPRIGAQRELKFALERYWRGELSSTELNETADAIKVSNWQTQQTLDWIPVGDFSLYDQVLDMAATLGALPDRISATAGEPLDHYFRMARGRSPSDSACQCSRAGAMLKWFNTNYHYIVPELNADTDFTLNSSRLIREVQLAHAHQITFKPVIIGPLTFLALSKITDQSEALDLLARLLPVYGQLLNQLHDHGATWVQIDEPILATDLSFAWQRAFEASYHQLQASPIKIILTTYFGELRSNLRLACELPVAGLHIDGVDGADEIGRVVDWLPSPKILSLGIINGRNIWKTDLTELVERLTPYADKLGERLWLAPSCSLLHVPIDLDSEQSLDAEVKNWLAFGKQKIAELTTVATALNEGPGAVAQELAANRLALASRKASDRLNNSAVRNAVAQFDVAGAQRKSPYAVRAPIQQTRLQLPELPTTTIGSFPQTAEIRQNRRRFKNGDCSADDYEREIKAEIARAIQRQEELGLDVLVHGEAERNDMVEYFGEQLDGFAFSQFGWVQSYGSRCVKPPLLYGDISRKQDMTVAWARYANSLTTKPVKGMLTGPVTLLNWSFVRDDQARADTCWQLAHAIRGEVLALEQAGIEIIQIDEAALREGLPLRKADWAAYLDWAIQAFRICANGVQDTTQIHTHMCYSEFNDILPAIADMDADVITIEASRSNLKLLTAFKDFAYPNAIGPGLYDIHSPNIPGVNELAELMKSFQALVPTNRLWINPDCGLKTRQWDEVIPALTNMVAATRVARSAYSKDVA